MRLSEKAVAPHANQREHAEELRRIAAVVEEQAVERWTPAWSGRGVAPGRIDELSAFE